MHSITLKKFCTTLPQLAPNIIEFTHSQSPNRVPLYHTRQSHHKLRSFCLSPPPSPLSARGAPAPRSHAAQQSCCATQSRRQASAGPAAPTPRRRRRPLPLCTAPLARRRLLARAGEPRPSYHIHPNTERTRVCCRDCCCHKQTNAQYSIGTVCPLLEGTAVLT